MKKIIISLGLVAFLFYSCEEVFYEADISEIIVEILAPTDGVELTVGTQTFSWNQVEDADTYSIQIATPNFENATQILLDSVTTETSIAKELLTSGEYQWRVKAVNSEYETNYTTNSFSVIE